MTETTDPKPSPSPPPSPPPALPPIDPNAILATAMAVLKTPAAFYASIRNEKGFQKTVVFSVIMFAVLGVCSMVWPIIHGWPGEALNALVVALVFGVLTPFLGGTVVWAVSVAFGSKATWEKGVPIAGYASAVAIGVGVGALVPYLGWLIRVVCWVYGGYLCYVGARTLLFEQPSPDAKPTA